MSNINGGRKFSFLTSNERQRLNYLKNQRTLINQERKELQSLLSKHGRETVANRKLASGDLKGLVSELSIFAVENYRNILSGGI